MSCYFHKSKAIPKVPGVLTFDYGFVAGAEEVKFLSSRICAVSYVILKGTFRGRAKFRPAASPPDAWAA
jgi:hypothetical protein